jgi:glycerophosphoryl diester phosphodiesterase
MALSSLLPILLAGLAGAEAQPQTMVLSHRGSTREWPANTYQALEAALGEGFPGFEIDVRFTKEGEPVLSHDDNLRAATECRGKLKATLLAQLQRCLVTRSPFLPEKRIGGKKAKFPSHIPTLAGVLTPLLPDPRVQAIVLDLKTCLGSSHIARLKEIIPSEPALRQKIIFITLHEADAQDLRDAFKDVRIALESDDTVSGLIDDFAQGADFWTGHEPYDTLSLSFGSIDKPTLRLVKLAKLENQTPARRFDALYRCNLAAPEGGRKKLLVWTVNNRAGIRRVAHYRPDYVLTDLTHKKFREALDRARPEARAYPPIACPASVPARIGASRE